MREIIEERMETTGHVTRLEKLTYTRYPLSTSGDGSRGSDRATVAVVEYIVTTGIRPWAPRPMFGTRTKLLKSLRAARAAFEAART